MICYMGKGEVLYQVLYEKTEMVCEVQFGETEVRYEVRLEI